MVRFSTCLFMTLFHKSHVLDGFYVFKFYTSLNKIAPIHVFGLKNNRNNFNSGENNAGVMLLFSSLQHLGTQES